jgi:hypothetical protein
MPVDALVEVHIDQERGDGRGDQCDQGWTVRHRIMHAAGQGDPGARRLMGLDRVAALELLASVHYGRVVLTQNALPAIRRSTISSTAGKSTYAPD